MSTQDTLSVLFKLASRSPSHSSQQSSAVVDAYLADSKKFDLPARLRKAFPTPTHALTRGEVVNSLRGVLQLHGEIEHTSLDRVVSNHLFAGIPLHALESAGCDSSMVQMQDQCVECLRTAISISNTVVNVISANWSAEMLTSAVRHAGLELDTLHPHSSADGHVVANMFKWEDGFSTGGIERRIVTALDKEREFDFMCEATLIKCVRIEDSATGQDAGVTVFLGDSVPDILALLRADVGIVIGKVMGLFSSNAGLHTHFHLYIMPGRNPQMWETMDIIGVPPRHCSLVPGDITSITCAGEWDCASPPVLYFADSWSEVQACLGIRSAKQHRAVL